MKNKILPINSTEGKWKHFKIKHVKPHNGVEKNKVNVHIQNYVTNHNGQYVYMNAEKGNHINAHFPFNINKKKQTVNILYKFN